jgi:excinuclease ABC subunit C
MREIVKSAASITWEACTTELEAELRETELIAALRPRWNVAGAFSFLYPSIGLGRSATGHAVLAFSTAPDEKPELAWHGAYRSREITGGAFFALIRLLAIIGHREKPARRPKGTRTWCFEMRRLPKEWQSAWSAFLRGEARLALTALAVSLLEKPSARRRGRAVEEDLAALDRFFRHEALKLADARRRMGETRWPIPQAERDALFLRARRAAPLTPSTA